MIPENQLDLYTYNTMKKVSTEEIQLIKHILTNPSGKRGAVSASKMNCDATTKQKSNGYSWGKSITSLNSPASNLTKLIQEA
jgi:hypothetical protein